MTGKREAILDATLELISERGFHGAPMSMIAEKADVGSGTIYRHFENKQSLITELYVQVKRQMGEAFLAGYSEELPLHERFRTLWLNILHYFMHHPHEMAFLEQFENSPYVIADDVKEVCEEYYEPLKRFFQYAFEQGVFKAMPTQMIATYTLSIAISLAKQHIAGELTLGDELKELAMSACWDALKR